MAGLTYSAQVDNVTVSALQDFFELTAPSDAVIELISCAIGQSSDAGDAEAELLRVQITRYATSGSGGSTPTARPHQVGYPASGATIEANNTTQGGTPTVIHSEAFNIQASPGWLYKPIPEERIWISPSGILAIEFPGAPTDALSMSGAITWTEHGG